MTDRLPSFSELRRMCRALWPDRRFGRFRVRTDGWANLILEADGIIFRFPRTASTAQSVGFEVRLLEYLSSRLSVVVPVPLRIGVLPPPVNWPFFCYAKIPGFPLSERPSWRASEQRSMARALDQLLRELVQLPTARLRRLGCAPGDVPHWGARYRRLLGRYDRVASRRLPREMDQRVRAEFSGFFQDLRRVHFRPVVSHRDLGPYNVLWDPSTRQVSGVIDWEDTRFGDPAFDLTGLTFLGPRRLQVLERSRRRFDDPTFDRRLRFYRRAMPLQELLFAVEAQRPTLYRQKFRELELGLRETSAPTPPGK